MDFRIHFYWEFYDLDHVLLRSTSEQKKIIFVYIKTKEILAISERHEQVLRQKKMGKKT